MKFLFKYFNSPRKATMSQLFNDKILSKSYLSRPDYSSEKVQKIINFWKKFNHDKNTDYRLNILDVGCGSGQLTLRLVPYGHSILGLDSSISQIEQAQKIFSERNINTAKFILGSYEDIPAPNLSVDLVTCAQAIHWFDIDQFYGEVDRCLKPGGVFTIMTYGRGYFIDGGEPSVFEELNKFVSQDFWYDSKYIGPYVTKQPRWAWSLLPGLKILYPNNSLRLDKESFDIKLSLRRYGQYLNSISMYKEWKKKNVNEEDIIHVTLQKILEYLGRPNLGLDMELCMRFPLCIIMCSKSKEDQ